MTRVNAILVVLLGSAGLLSAAGCSQVHPEPELQVVNALNHRADAWNRGDLATFLDGYWQSDELTVIDGDTTLTGWPAVQDACKRRLRSTEQPGRLVYDRLNTQPSTEDTIDVTGRWMRKEEAGAAGGTFSCTFRRINGRWLIVRERRSM